MVCIGLNLILFNSNSENFDKCLGRRSRIQFNQWQIADLERVFLITHYPNVFLRGELAMRLNISENRIQAILKTFKFYRKIKHKFFSDLVSE